MHPITDSLLGEFDQATLDTTLGRIDDDAYYKSQSAFWITLGMQDHKVGPIGT